MNRRLLLLAGCAVVIAGVVGFKLAYPQWHLLEGRRGLAAISQPAPLFQLYDQNSEIVRLQRYLGRHKLVVVFFDPQRGIGDNPLLMTLSEHLLELHQARAVVLAISSARPAEHRQGAERGTKVAFPLLSDLELWVHRRWGAFDVERNQPREAVFIIDRAGRIRHVHLGPDNLGDGSTWVTELQEAP